MSGRTTSKAEITDLPPGGWSEASEQAVRNFVSIRSCGPLSLRNEGRGIDGSSQHGDSSLTRVTLMSVESASESGSMAFVAYEQLIRNAPALSSKLNWWWDILKSVYVVAGLHNVALVTLFFLFHQQPWSIDARL